MAKENNEKKMGMGWILLFSMFAFGPLVNKIDSGFLWFLFVGFYLCMGIYYFCKFIGGK